MSFSHSLTSDILSDMEEGIKFLRNIKQSVFSYATSFGHCKTEVLRLMNWKMTTYAGKVSSLKKPNMSN